MPKPRSITKSQFLAGRQCQKLLWHSVNDPSAIPTDAGQSTALEQGHEVGRMAHRLFPAGQIIDARPGDLAGALKMTAAALVERRPLFEAAFATEDAIIRVDILAPSGKAAWDLYEVKSSTSVKDEHIEDVAFQLRVLRANRIAVRRCHVVHINSDYVRHGDIVPEQMFTRVDVTDLVVDALPELERKISDQNRVLRSPASPTVAIGPHCDSPRTCPLHENCWSFLPKRSVLTLASGRAKGFKLLADGVKRLADIPPDVKLTTKQRTQRDAVISGTPFVDTLAVKAFLARLKYPLHFLDFETFATAIPMFDGVRPYQAVPFQFSLHIQAGLDSAPAHRAFLADGRHDPRQEFMRRLIESIENSGSVVVYNAAFEKGVLDGCAAAMPEFSIWVAQVKSRVVDLLVPFRSFHLYHPAQDGSASLKATMPAWTGTGYEALEIQDGNTASAEFLRISFGQVPEIERRRVRRRLEAYCGRDTEGMVWLLGRVSMSLAKVP